MPDLGEQLRQHIDEITPPVSAAEVQQTTMQSPRPGKRSARVLVAVALAGAIGVIAAALALRADDRSSVDVIAGNGSKNGQEAGDRSNGPNGFAGNPDGARVSHQQEELLADQETVQHYGEAHPDEWVGVRYDNSSDPVRLVAGFTGHLDMHRANLRTLVEHPSRLVVEALQYSAPELERIKIELQAELFSGPGSPGRTLGTGWGVLIVGLAPTAERTAKAIVDRYGPAIRVTIGNLPYPVRGGIRCPALPETTSSAPNLELRLELTSATVRSGEDISGRLIVRNRGAEALPLESSQPVTSGLLYPGTDRVAGSFGGSVAGTGVGTIVPPGGETTLPIIIGTGGCSSDVGYLLPPGSFDAFVTMDVFGTDSRSGARRRDQIRSPIVPVTLK